MRVTERPGANPVSGTTNSQRPGAATSRFSLGGGSGPERASSAQAAAPVGAMMGLLAVQASGDALERRKRAMRRGRNILDTLDQLKIAILSGRISPAQLETLKAQLHQRAEATEDPGLAEVLAHIELRAEVELAKLARG
jgi:Class II flagellar assembly regulator